MKVPVYVIGGFVRDILLKRQSKDIDFVTVGNGIEIAERVAKKIGKDVNVTVFKKFGTAMLRYEGYEIEFVGARKESYRSDSRKPLVEDGTIEDDQNRRDFTINALSISVQEHNFGELIDPFDGQRDIKDGIIRTPLDPDITFSDDPLRMMRAVRFAAQLGFEIEETCYISIIKNCERIGIVSMERITEELNKIILSPKPSYGFKKLSDMGLLAIVFPQMIKLQGVTEVDGKAHKDNFYHTLQVLDNISQRSDDLWLRWGAILHDIAKPQTKRFDEKTGWTFHGHEYIGSKMVPGIFRKLRLPLNEKMRYVQKLVRLHLRPIALVASEVSDSGVRRLLFEAGDSIDDLMMLCEADITSKNPYKIKRYIKNFGVVRKKLKDIEEKDKLRNWQPPITGEMIMETFGIEPGKNIGIIKSAIREAILDGEVENNKDAAYNFMLEKGKELGLSVKKKGSVTK